MTGRTLAIGDIHGCDAALDVLLSKLAPGSEDTLVVLGDAIDRGPGTCDVIERLLDVQKCCRLRFVLGNHEEMLFDALAMGRPSERWQAYGGRHTLASYGGRLDRIPDAHREFLADGLPYWETESEIFVHANLEPGVPLSEQTQHWLRWQRLTGLEFPHPSGKRVFCGHSGVSTGLPTTLDGWVCLDTLAYRGLFLTGLDVGTGEIFQTQQSGAFRSGVTLNDLT